MVTRCRVFVALMVVLTLSAGCGQAEPTATPMPPVATPTQVPPTATQPPPTSPTSTQPPSTLTPLPPTDTPVPEPTAQEAAAQEAGATEKDVATVPFTKSGQDLGDTRTFGVVIADIDRDGDHDIFIANYTGPSTFWLNDGHGTFAQSGQRFDVPEVHGAAIQDLNGDAYPDILLLGHATPSKVYFNDGAGHFTDSGQNIGSAGDSPGMVVLGDVDGDGDQDAFISYFNAANRLWLNDGSGVFAVTDTEYGGGGKSYEMVLDDFNGDTFLDLFLSMSDQPDEVWLNDGLGNLENSGQALGSHLGDDHPASGDVDGDGDPDLVVANSAEGVKVWLNQDNAGTFVEAGPYRGEGATECRLLDADLDGDLDLISACLENGSQLWLNDGSGAFTPAGQLMGEARVLSLATGDLDGDGDQDLVFGALEGTGGNAIYFNDANPATASITADSWFKTYGGNQNDVANDVVPSGDGGFFIVGVTNLEFEAEQRGDVYLIKTNAAGEIVWEKTYDGEGYMAGATVFRTDDGRLLISGSTRSPENDGLDIFVMEVDSDGNELWSRTFGGPLDEVGAAWPLDDGGYILGGNLVDPNDLVVDNPGVAGYAGFAGRSNVYLARIDAEGNELWSRTFGGENNVIALSALPAADGGFVILATIMYFPENDDDIYLLKVDEDGNEVWSRTWDQGMSSGYDLVGTPDGNYLVTGPYSPPDEMDRLVKDFLFIEFDNQGNEVWTSTFGDPDSVDYGQVLAATADGGYVAAGGATRDLMTWDDDIVIVKIDERGQRLWQQTVETGTHSMFGGILEHPDGGYVVAGSIFNGQDFDAFLIKTDAAGNVTSPAEPAGAAPDPEPERATISLDTVDKIERLRTIDGHDGRIYGLDFSSDGALLASGSHDGTIRLWEVGSWQEKGIVNHPGEWTVFFAPDDTHVATADGTIWDIASGERVRSLEARQSHVAFSPDGAWMASAEYNSPIDIWDVETWQVVQTLEGHSDQVFGMAFSPDGTLLASGSGMGPSDVSDYMVKVWDITNGVEVHALKGHSGDIHAVAFSPDGKFIASASTDYSVRLWDVQSGELIHTLRHRNGLYDVTFSPDGSLLASASCDHTAKLWDVASGRLLDSLQHGDEVMAVTFSPDGTLLASGGYDNKVYLWGVHP